jgi:hypothetical protein
MAAKLATSKGTFADTKRVRRANRELVMKKITIGTVIGLLLLAFSLWMNRYRYEQKGVMTVRINRFTSQVCYSQPDGTWNSNLHPSDGFQAYRPDGTFDPPEVNKCE